MNRRVGRVYGVGNSPVELIGNIALEVDTGDNPGNHAFFRSIA